MNQCRDEIHSPVSSIHTEDPRIFRAVNLRGPSPTSELWGEILGMCRGMCKFTLNFGRSSVDRNLSDLDSPRCISVARGPVHPDILTGFYNTCVLECDRDQ